MTKKLEDGQVLIHGKVYDTVARRVKAFRGQTGVDAVFEGYVIVTKIHSIDDEKVVMKAIIRDAKDRILATGHAEEDRQASSINKTSAVENCETSAIGRALATFGMGGTEFASADEVAQAISQQNDPSDSPKLTGPATDKQKLTISNTLAKYGVSIEDMEGYLIERFGVEVPLTKEGASFVIGELFDREKE